MEEAEVTELALAALENPDELAPELEDAVVEL